jgi:hypothetical protein
MLWSFPLECSEEFNNTPPLIGSQNGAEHEAVQAAGQWQSGDRFWLMTDAVAEWCLQQETAGRAPWAKLEDMISAPNAQAAFARWVDELRNGRELRNDDTTVVLVTV